MKKDGEKKLLIGGLVVGAVLGAIALIGRACYKGYEEVDEDAINSIADEENEDEDGEDADENIISSRGCGSNKSCSSQDMIKTCSHCGGHLNFIHPTQPTSAV